MNDWIDECYRRIDSGDSSSHEMWADDIYVQVGNHPPTCTKTDALTDGAFRRVHEAVSSVTHEMLGRWNISDDRVVLPSLVNCHRRDGRTVKLPAVTTIRRNAFGLLDDLRLFIDATSLYEGFCARVVGSVAVAVDPPKQ